jgi:hypothetical protein
MDPYLEGHLWPDVHHELASKIREQLTPKLRPKYVARIEVYVVTDDDPLAEVGIMYSDIEILSPVNKRGQGLTQYHQKRQSILEAKVHLLEIDLLRRGQRPLNQPVIPASDYRIMLTRAPASKVEIWPIALLDLLPVLPIPLRTPDDDVTLDLGQALQEVYEAGAYDLTVDYTASPPPPALSLEENLWLENQLKAAGLRT